VAQWLGRWIRDREVASSTPGVCVSE